MKFIFQSILSLTFLAVIGVITGLIMMFDVQQKSFEEEVGVCGGVIMSDGSRERQIIDSVDNPKLEWGGKLFKVNCKACHKRDRPATGPALRGVTQRRDSTWIRTFIRNPQVMIDSGDTTAIKMFEEYGSVMTAFPSITDDEIDCILEYVETDGYHF